MDGKKLFYLTHSEVQKITHWIAENDYTFSAGHFELKFSFTAYGDCIEFTSFQNGKKDVLVVNNDSSVDDPQRTVGHMVVGDQHVGLALSDEGLELYFQLNSEITEAHVNEDCEPPGSNLVFDIHHDYCNVFSGQRQLIEARK